MYVHTEQNKFVPDSKHKDTHLHTHKYTCMYVLVCMYCIHVCMYVLHTCTYCMCVCLITSVSGSDTSMMPQIYAWLCYTRHPHSIHITCTYNTCMHHLSRGSDASNLRTVVLSATPSLHTSMAANDLFTTHCVTCSYPLSPSKSRAPDSESESPYS